MIDANFAELAAIDASLIKAGNFTPVQAEMNNIVGFNSGSAVQLILNTGLTSGSWLWIFNLGAGVLTILATVNGTVNPTLAQYDQAFVWTNGTSWFGKILNFNYPNYQAGNALYAVDSGAADVYVATLSPPISGLTTGMRIWVKITHANATTTPTLNLNGKGAVTIIRSDTGGVLVVGDLQTNGYYLFQYDGTNWRLMNPNYAQIPKSKCRIYLAGAQSLGASPAKIALDTKSFDTDGIADVTTNHRITPNNPGYYRVATLVSVNSLANNQIGAYLYKNGSEYSHNDGYNNLGAFGTPLSDDIYFNGTTDYLELYGKASVGSPDLIAGSNQTFLTIIGPF